MGKKKGKSGKIYVQKKDVFHRLNYLYQAAHFALSMTPPNIELARHYTTTLKTLAMRNVVRLSPHIKRTLCKRCNMLLLPGCTSCMRIRRKDKQKYVVIHCLHCTTIKKFLLNPAHELWHDKPENIAQIITLQQQ